MRERLINEIDNCLICESSDIKDNEVAKIFERIGFKWVADNLSIFPVVVCKKKGNKFVANPRTRPGWCPLGKH